MAGAAAVLASAFACLTAPSAQAADTVELIVARDPGLTRAQRVELRAEAGVALQRQLTLSHTELVSVPAAQAERALAALNRDPGVRYAEPNAQVRAQDVPFRVPANDPLLALQWPIQNTGPVPDVPHESVPDADMDVREAWNLALGDNVTVAVVDTGLQADHPDLAGRLARNPGEQPGNGLDDDGNGFTDDVSGWDFLDRDNNPAHPDNGHGTSVAGTVVAVRNNSLGVVGVAPAAQVMPLRVLGDTGIGTWAGVAEAFDYAGRMGIPVVNASLGAIDEVQVVTDAIARHPHTLYVAAAGNNEVDLETRQFWPCEAPRTNVLCVGASDLTDARATFSNYGSQAVDIFAPGLNSMTTSPLSAYTWFAGTSMAAPNAAAVAALAVSAGFAGDPAALRALLLDRADRKPALTGLAVSGGRVNALTVLKALRPDTDDDGVADSGDVCPNRYALPINGCPPQDQDGDEVDLPTDNCPEHPNRDQADSDADGQGDVCDPTPRGPDTDLDGVAQLDDNCPAHANRDQADADADGQGDICDPTPRGPDTDLDGVADRDDRCPTQPGPVDTAGCARDDEQAGQPPRLTVLALTRRRGRIRARLRADQRATVTLAVQRRSCRRGRCRYVTVRGYRLQLAAEQPKLVALGRLVPGRYRLQASARNANGTSTRSSPPFAISSGR